jgi:hypothetical protein
MGIYMKLFLSFFAILFSMNFSHADEANDRHFIETMTAHLNAVTNRDLATLKSTLSPNGEMQLILPDSEIIYTVQGFMDYHVNWFSEPSWTFDTKILNTEIGDTMGMAIVEIMYKEPDRGGNPYFNRMIVSYDLKKINHQWYIIKDHASSVEHTE